MRHLSIYYSYPGAGILLVCSRWCSAVLMCAGIKRGNSLGLRNGTHSRGFGIACIPVGSTVVYQTIRVRSGPSARESAGSTTRARRFESISETQVSVSANAFTARL